MYVYLFTFGCAVSVAPWLFSSCCERGSSLACGVWASHSCGFSGRSVGSKEHGLRSWGSWALEHRLSCSVACGIFSENGTNLCLQRNEPVSPALAGGFFTTGLPGKPYWFFWSLTILSKNGIYFTWSHASIIVRKIEYLFIVLRIICIFFSVKQHW